MSLPAFCPGCGRETRGQHVGQEWGPDIAAEIEAEVGEPVSAEPWPMVPPPGRITTASGSEVLHTSLYCDECAAAWREQIADYRRRLAARSAPESAPPTPPEPPLPPPPEPPVPEPPKPPKPPRGMRRGRK